jgi:hypothetical protein
MTHGEETIDVTTSLARVRDNLLVAIAADHRRSRRRRRVRLTGLALAATLASTTAVAATAGLFSPAPDSVKGQFGELGPGVDASKAVEIGVIDEHAAYAAPTEDGGFCLYFAPNPRSGPSGTACLLDPVGSDEIALAPQLGHDGGFVFGRVGAESAATVEIKLTEQSGVLTTPVGTDGFFLIEIPQSVMGVLMEGGAFDERRLEALTATARDAQGETVARSKTPFTDPWGPEPTATPEP